ncbi:uncharacterized protein BKA55DRAFT_534809 [Fusarium redolens]|uniref:Uncharacterized protein n=1 Tax=Fusarium redolens TaxID=48865 RepID=A0A9P9HXP4_FUSRE|nr:uncharacterized protein BKA55DRAFT_534809 [Fusarium redolens]KAH7264847.1 hypothetical protein BKA55DRAFT_534809 [Fusarium redolens]
MSRISGGNVYGPFGVTVFPRSGFGDRTGGTAIGWPAKGGYLTHSCSLVELEFLGLDRFQRTNMSHDPEKEEAHCAKMRLLGAKWYRNPYQELLDETAEKDIDSPRLFVGVTADGGVWVIYTTLLGSRREGLGRLKFPQRVFMIDPLLSTQILMLWLAIPSIAYITTIS